MRPARSIPAFAVFGSLLVAPSALARLSTKLSTGKSKMLKPLPQNLEHLEHLSFRPRRTAYYWSPLGRFGSA